MHITKTANALYGWDPYAFSKTLYEASPLDRVAEECGPGSPWHTRGKSVRTERLVNEAAGLLSCPGLSVASDTSLAVSGPLPAGTLSVLKVTDEDGGVTLTFTDRLGRTVLERRVDGSRTLDTHRVYDDLGLLRYVLTPEASAAMSSEGTFGDSSSPLSTLAYIHKYDGRGRCVSKRQPGCAPILYRYDKGDAPVFTQDGEMRKRGEWRFSFRDPLGRDAVNGVWPSSTAPSLTGASVVATYTGASSLGGYSLNIPVPADNRLLSVSYYDGHSFMDDLLPSATRQALSADTPSGYGIPVTGAGRSKGLLTGTTVHSLTDPASKTVSSFYYDRHGRLVQSHHSEAPGGYRHVHRSLTFTGKPLGTRETIALPDGRVDSLVTVMSYDGQERPVSETASLNGKTQTVSYTYDGIGRLTGRTHGLGNSLSGLAETLTYNIRDQLTGLNSDVFGMTLRYHDPALGSAPRYNGTVSEWEWNHGSGTETDAWSLSYDGAGRLTDARRFTGGVSTDAFGERSVTYDRNGNVLTLTRYGADATGPEDVLAYSYTGNRLRSITNTGTSGGGGAYTHDTNGNMTHDGLSGLDVEYDAMNLTRRVSSGGATLAEYEHLADGTKLSAVDGNGDGYQYRGSLIYSRTADRSGAESLALDCALTTAGRIARVTNSDGTVSYRPFIHLRDHLGSVRAVVDGDTGSVVETNDYYPFGKRIAISTAPEHAEGSLHATVPTVTSTGSATCPNRWRFSGKEDQSFLNAGIPLLDFGARMYNPTTARWTAADPMAEKYLGISPYAYCLNNPVNSIDPDGKVVWFIPLIKGVVGAAVDAGAQVTISMSSGKTFMESLKSVDLTSVGTSLITSALLSPGASKGVQAAVVGVNVGLNLLDAGVDYSIEKGTETVFDEKSIGKATVEFTFGIASGLASNGVQKAFEKDANAKLAPSVAAPLTKAERASLRSRRDFAKSEKFQIILDDTFSFTFGMTGNTIVEFIPPPKDVKDEKEEQ